jgi:hypothetical protein
MPFKSEKQRRWMHANEPDMAKKWEKKYKKEDRDYKDEYKKFQSSKKAKKYRAELNKYNRKKGTYGNGDGKDASHKGGKIVGFEAQSKNRGRAEKSRLKKESTLNELTPQQVIATLVDVAMRRTDNIIKALVKDVAKRDRNKAMELMKLYKKYFVEFSSRAKVSNPIKDGVNEAKDPDVIAQIRGVLKKGYSNVKDPVSGKKMKMDSYTASAITQVYDAINTSNKKKFSKLPILKMQNIAFKVIKK